MAPLFGSARCILSVMATIRSNVSRFVTASLMLSLGIGVVYPRGLISGQSINDALSAEHASKTCCCGTPDGSCCGTICCQVPDPKQDKAPRRTDDRAQPLVFKAVEVADLSLAPSAFHGHTLAFRDCPQAQTLSALNIRFNI